MNEWIDLPLGQGKEVEELLILVLVASLIGGYFPFRGSWCQEFARLQSDVGRETRRVWTLVSGDSNVADCGLVLLSALVGVTFISDAYNPAGCVSRWSQGLQGCTKNLCAEAWETRVVPAGR